MNSGIEHHIRGVLVISVALLALAAIDTACRGVNPPAKHGEVKCPVARYVVRGAVIDQDGKRPIQGAKVYVFLDDYDFATSYVSEGRVRQTRFRQDPDFSITSSEGTYEVTVYYYTYEREVGDGTDICTRRPGVIELLIVGDGYLARRRQLDKSEFNLVETGFAEGTIDVPLTEMVPTRD